MLWLSLFFAFFLRYYKNQHLNSTQFRKGFFCTNDLALYDSNGSLCVKGKEFETLRQGDISIHASELEDLILKYRGVQDVCVFCKYNEIVACIIKKEQCGITLESLQKLVVTS